MREYCHRYSQQPDEDQEQPRQARQDCLVPPEDVAGLSAFLCLFSQVRSSLARFLWSVLSLASDRILRFAHLLCAPFFSYIVLCAVLCQIMLAMLCLLGHCCHLCSTHVLRHAILPCFALLCHALPCNGFKQSVYCGVQCSANSLTWLSMLHQLGCKQGQHTPDVPSLLPSLELIT